jgi:predicted transposase/invertase (TIGR01784 family)
MKPPKRLDPTLDIVFKLLLLREPLLLHDMLQCILGRPLGAVEVLDRTLPGELPRDKSVVLDVRVRLQDGVRVVIEMQVRTARTFASRLLVYGARDYSDQLRKGNVYDLLTPTIVIAWLVQPLFPGRRRLHSRFRMLEVDDHTELTDQLTVHVLQLSALSRLSPRVATGYDAQVERWARFLRARTDAELAQLAAEDPIMSLAKDTLDQLSQDPEACRLARRRADDLALYKMDLAAARVDGKAEVLLQLLTLRFGPLSEAAHGRLESAHRAELERWFERVLTAQSLDEVLAEDPLDPISRDAPLRSLGRDDDDDLALSTMDLAAAREDGQLEGKAELLLKLLTLRFGPLCAADRTRVESAGEAALDTWAERVLTAPTLDEVLAPH